MKYIIVIWFAMVSVGLGVVFSNAVIAAEDATNHYN